MKTSEGNQTYRISLKQTILQELSQVLKLELNNLVLTPLEDRNRESEDSLNSLSKDEVKDGRDELEWEAVAAKRASERQLPLRSRTRV